MRRVYTGLLLFGASVAAHAGEAVEAVRSAKGVSANVSYREVVPLAPAAVLRNSVVFAKANDASGGESSANVSPTEMGAAQKLDSAEALKQSHRNLANVLGALRFKRLKLEGEQLKLTLRPHSAEAEMNQIKLALQSDSTSITWNKSF